MAAALGSRFWVFEVDGFDAVGRKRGRRWKGWWWVKLGFEFG